jgi:hypothetical protein
MLPDSLIRFRGDLERAIARDLIAERSARHRRTMARGAAALAAVAAIAFGVVALAPDDAPVVGRIVDSASASQRAAAVLSAAAGSLVHEVAVHRRARSDGSMSTWREESWRETSAPHRRRHVTTRADGTRIETATVGSEAAQLYDAARDTIYTNPPRSGAALGTPAPAGDGDPLRAQILQLLRSRDAREISRQQVRGRDAIRFVYRNAAPGGSVVTWTYAVDATDFTPIEVTTAVAGEPRDTITFETYESTHGYDERLLSLRAAHPDADVDATEAGYEAARARLYSSP